MFKPRDVIMPERIRRLQTDVRGFPIPYVIMRDAQGLPHFAINDIIKVEFALKHRLCAICGWGMKSDDLWLAGGSISAFHPNGAFNDTPMHYECAEYAMQVCPYLAARKWNVIDGSAEKIVSKALKGGVKAKAFLDPTQIPGKPEHFCLIQVSGWRVNRRGGVHYVMPTKPYLKVEVWTAGSKLEDDISAGLVAGWIAEHKEKVSGTD